MGDAWIYATGKVTDELMRLLAELGFTPRRKALNGRTHGRPPALAIVIATPEHSQVERLCSELKSRKELTDVPVILAVDPEHLHTLSGVIDADELLVPPYSVAELRVRVARARRANGYADKGEEVMRVGAMTLDLASRDVKVRGASAGFTYMEYELLKFLMTHSRRAYSRETLLARVWGHAHFGSARTVDVHVRRVRAKLGPEHAQLVKTVRGVGYLFDDA